MNTDPRPADVRHKPEPRCATCRFSKHDQGTGHTRCHFGPPTADLQAGVPASFPIVLAHWSCHRFKRGSMSRPAPRRVDG